MPLLVWCVAGLLLLEKNTVGLGGLIGSMEWDACLGWPRQQW